MKNIIKYSILYLIFTTSIIMSHSLDKDSIVTIDTEEDLKSLLTKNQGPSAISFHMDKCGWCTKMHPIFESLANDDQFEHITFYRVNGPVLRAHTHSKNILTESIDGYPSIFFMNQGKIVDKQVGGGSQDVIIQKLNNLSNAKPLNKQNSQQRQPKFQRKPRAHKATETSLAGAGM